MDSITLNHLSKLKYKDPRQWLIKLSDIERNYSPLIPDPKLRALRTQKMKWVRESREAALFCYGMSKVIGHEISFALKEESDFDCVARWVEGEIENYTLIQLKELVPEKYNSEANINQLIKDTTIKYQSSKELHVAIFVNRNLRIEFEKLEIPPTTLGGIWLYGNVGNDEWFVYGNLIVNPVLSKFEYPKMISKN